MLHSQNKISLLPGYTLFPFHLLQVIAYLMKENRWSLEKALAFVQEKRNVINPNTGFREQLTTYEGMLKARSVISIAIWEMFVRNKLAI